MPDQPSDFLASFMEDYFAEAEEHLTAVRRGLLILEPAVGGGDLPPAVVEELFRSFHSVKGTSAMVELGEAERLAHEMESCLGSFRDHRFVLTAPAFEALVDGATMLERVIAARRARVAIPPVDRAIAHLAQACSDAAARSEHTTAPPAIAQSTGAAAAHGSLWTVTFTPTPELVARGVKVDTIRERLSGIGRIESVAPRVTAAGGISFEFQVRTSNVDALASWNDDGVSHAPAAAPAPAIPDPSRESRAPLSLGAADSPSAVMNFVRVDLSRLDDLMRLVGDLVVSRARLEDTVLRVEQFMPAAEWRALQDETESIERQLRDLREGVMRVRLVPVAEIFRRMPFVVRDLGRDSNRRVRLEMSGQATEIDKFLVDRMRDSVLHVVRNAVSHGLETADERIAAEHEELASAAIDHAAGIEQVRGVQFGDGLRCANGAATEEVDHEHVDDSTSRAGEVQLRQLAARAAMPGAFKDRGRPLGCVGVDAGERKRRAPAIVVVNVLPVARPDVASRGSTTDGAAQASRPVAHEIQPVPVTRQFGFAVLVGRVTGHPRIDVDREAQRLLPGRVAVSAVRHPQIEVIHRIVRAAGAVGGEKQAVAVAG